MSKTYIKRVILTLLFVIVISSVVIGYNKLSAAGGEAGTIDDPLVSKSYVDEKNEEILSLVEEMLGNVNIEDTGNSDDETIYMEDVYNYIDTKIENVEVNGIDVSEGFIVLELEAGDKLICDESTEIVLRYGDANAIGNSGGDGLSDVTSGVDIKDGQVISINHLLIIPRTDGRGIVAKSKCFIMVKGNYSIDSE